jgi:hypothetical protein
MSGGHARAAKGCFRIDEIPLSVKLGSNIQAVEVAGYYAKSNLSVMSCFRNDELV